MLRRDFIQHAAVLSAAALTEQPVWRKKRWKIGACDWSLGKQANLEAFDIAQAIGLDGVQVSYNSQADENWLQRPETIQAIQAAVRRTGVQVASLAIGELNRTPLKKEAKTVDWIKNAVLAAEKLQVKVVLLAFFSDGDLRNDPDGQERVIERLRLVAPLAEQKNITLGLESYLSGPDHLRIIRAVGSPAIQVYYDFRNSADAGYDVLSELPDLRKYICEIHMKENGFLLGQGTLDWTAIAQKVQRNGYKGWMQIEGAKPSGQDIVSAYQHNLAYLKTVFQM